MTLIFLVSEPRWGCGLVGRAFASICEAVDLIDHGVYGVLLHTATSNK